MSEAKPCPYCGTPLPVDFVPALAEAMPPEAPEPVEDGPEVEENDPDVEAVPLLAPGSNDDSFLNVPFGRRLAAVTPDPILGEYVSRSSETATSPAVANDALDGPSESFPSLDFDRQGQPGPAPAPAARVEGPEGPDDEEDEDEADERRTPWSSVLLASYASAMTLAFAWTWMKDRVREKAEPVIKAPAAPEPARQAGLSRKVEPPEPIVGEHFATFGKPIAVGSLEVTPIEAKRQDVTLQRLDLSGKPDRRDEGKQALALRLKLRNISNDAVFAPLDQAYLRERGKDLVDTFVETQDKERVYPYPLAIESEWSIVGQDFAELRPGESRIVDIVTAPEAPPDSAGPFTWRVRLRTGIDRTDVIGVRWPEKPAGKDPK